jgi:DNA-binding response OmpR family regulator
MLCPAPTLWKPACTLRQPPLILVVDDDPDQREIMCWRLATQGYKTIVAADGEEALSTARAQLPDLIMLDASMPRLDGFEVCRRLKADPAFPFTPIIMVTALAAVEDVVAGLEAGADDYLTKPFEPKELSARIRALLRRVRPAQPGHERLVFGDLELIPEEGKVLRGGTEVHLTKTEFRLLCELAENRGKVFSREELLDKVWGYDYFGDGRLVDVHIRRLRTKVETDAAAPRHVVTVRGLGYRLE